MGKKIRILLLFSIFLLLIFCFFFYSSKRINLNRYLREIPIVKNGDVKASIGKNKPQEFQLILNDEIFNFQYDSDFIYGSMNPDNEKSRIVFALLAQSVQLSQKNKADSYEKYLNGTFSYYNLKNNGILFKKIDELNFTFQISRNVIKTISPEELLLSTDSLKELLDTIVYLKDYPEVFFREEPVSFFTRKEDGKKYIYVIEKNYSSELSRLMIGNMISVILNEEKKIDFLRDNPLLTDSIKTTDYEIDLMTDDFIIENFTNIQNDFFADEVSYVKLYFPKLDSINLVLE